MAISLFSRRYVSMLSHWLGWGLLGYLLFFSQWFGADFVAPREYWIRQTIFFGLMVGAFYLNAQLLVPRLLLTARPGRYVASLIGLLLLTVLIIGGIEFAFDLPTKFHRLFHPDGGGQPRYYGWVQSTLFTTMLTLGSSTSLAMVQKWQTDANTRLALEQARTSSELSFLKAQINPHFFFNTLNNIYALTLIDADTARSAIHRLSRMMRYVLYDTQSDTTLLSKEVGFLGDYIQLMQLRLTDKVVVCFHTPAPLHDQAIAPMLFLPFVENAFKHGVSALHTSQVHVSMEQQPGQLRFTVWNTLFRDKTPSLEAGSGIGLNNTRRRLDLLYPGQYALQTEADESTAQYRVVLTLNQL